MSSSSQISAAVAAPRAVNEDWMPLKEWHARHERHLKSPRREGAGIVFIGDSITEGWELAPAYERRFESYRPFNLGIGGDHTQHVLWRIQEGALDGLNPRVLVILIGVNNLNNSFSPEQTAGGIVAVVRASQAKLPAAKLLLLPILPAGQTEGDPLRRKIQQTNQGLSALSDPPTLTVQDVGHSLVEADGSIDTATMEDFLHPTFAGYERLTEAVGPVVARMME